MSYCYTDMPKITCVPQDSAFPLYDQVKAEHVVPGVTQLLADLNAEIDQLEQSVQPTFEGLVEPLERISDRLGRAWGTVSHLKAGTRRSHFPSCALAALAWRLGAGPCGTVVPPVGRQPAVPPLSATPKPRSVAVSACVAPAGLPGASQPERGML